MNRLNEEYEIHENLEEILEEEDDYSLDGLIGTTMNLVLEDEREIQAVIIAAFAIEEYPWNYIALLPLLEEDEEEESDVILYRFMVDEEGSPVLELMESDEEYEAVADAFYKELEKMEKETEE